MGAMKKRRGRPTNQQRAVRALVAVTVAKLQAEIDRGLAERLAAIAKTIGR